MRRGMIRVTFIKVFIFSLAIVFLSQVISKAKSSRQDPKSAPGGTIVQEPEIPEPQYVLDEIIIKLKSEAHSAISTTVDADNNVITGLHSFDKLNKKHGVIKMKQLLSKAGQKPKRKLSSKAEKKRQHLLRIYKLKLKKNTNILGLISEYEKDPNVEYAEPNYILQTDVTVPNDPDYGQQWGLDNTGQAGGFSGADIDAPEAWDIETGDPNVVIAVVDTGVNWLHPDLSANIWTNPGEIADNGIDDDGNGYIDDYRGWDFVTVSLKDVYPREDPGPEDNDPMDFYGHGTHVSGIIGAVTNNSTGMAGVAWNCKIMPVRAGFKNSRGGGSILTGDVANALIYASDNGADIVNMSFSSSVETMTLRDTIDYAYAAGVTLVAASGNNDCKCERYPASFNNVIAVGASTSSDERAYFSNFGNWIDVVAPGLDIYSTWLNNTYATSSGTSMAAPNVCGVAGLILSKNPGFSNEEVREVLRKSADDLGYPGRDIYYGTGRVNAFNALQYDTVCLARIDTPHPGEYLAGTVNIVGTASGANFVSYRVYFAKGSNPEQGQWEQIGATSYSQVNGGVLESWDTKTVSDGRYTLKVVTEDSLSNIFEEKQLVNVKNVYLTVYVPDDYPTIQTAINFSTFGDTIIVRSGTYNENIYFYHKAITVRSESGPESTTIDGGGVNSVVRFNEEIEGSGTLDGFTLTNGVARYGGAVFCAPNTSPTINNCIMTGNSAFRGGGVSMEEHCSPIIQNCTITNNTAEHYGGGIYLYWYCSPAITNCIISNNYAGVFGGGIHIIGYCSPVITGCTISENTVGSGGGSGAGIYACYSTPIISDCTIDGNSGPGGGGGISFVDCPGKVTGCYITNNIMSRGGGLECSASLGATQEIVNCVISGNSSTGTGTGMWPGGVGWVGGGAIYSRGGAMPTIINSVLSVNTSASYGGAIYSYDNSPVVINSILWGNKAGGNPNEIYLDGTSTIDITYSAIEGGYSGLGNINSDPLFLSSRNFRLQPGSPCIDAANSDDPTPAGDMDGNARYDDPGTANSGTGVNGDYYDIGAYEYTGVNCVDGDSDGYYSDPACDDIPDCDDTDPTIYPGASELCDGIDNNCSGSVDEGLLTTYYPDADEDGYGDPNVSIEDCSIPSAGYVTDNTDCDDTDSAINPGAAEACGDGIDNDCDYQIDEGCCTDADGDGYYAEAGCGTEIDCDDSNPNINPGACDIKRNGIDENCDGSDRLSGPPCHRGAPEFCDDGKDNDRDGDIDCADTDCTNDPACGGGCVPVPEICDDGIDNDCDGKADCADIRDCRNFPGCLGPPLFL